MSEPRDQRAFWTDTAGPVWVDQRAPMDAALAAILEGTLARARLKEGDSVLDIGCGAGTSTLEIARRIGADGHVTGIDISSTLLDAALARTAGQSNIAFLCADAQTHPFVPHSADVITSRFGVMFFEDTRAAFANMARALRPEGVMAFSVWAEIAENPFFTLPARIAHDLLGPVPKSDPDAPGPFALRDPARLAQVMQAAGLVAQIETVTEDMVLSEGAAAMAQVMCHIGPAQKALSHHAATQAQHASLLNALTAALAAHETPRGIVLPARISYVTARKSP